MDRPIVLWENRSLPYSKEVELAWTRSLAAALIEQGVAVDIAEIRAVQALREARVVAAG